MRCPQWTLAPVAMAAFGFTMAWAPADEPSAAITVRGRITDVQPGQRQVTIRTRDGRDLILNVDEHTTLQLKKQPATLDAFHVGTHVRVVYDAAGNRILTLSSPALSLEDLKKNLRETMEAAKSYTYEQKDEYRKKLEPAMRDLDERMAELKLKMQSASADARERYDRDMEDFRLKREALRERLSKVKAAGPEVWADVKSGIGAAVKELHDAIDKAKSRLDSPELPPDR